MPTNVFINFAQCEKRAGGDSNIEIYMERKTFPQNDNTLFLPRISHL